jgi:NDP-sugar pyrophosphorylase family protein
VDFVCLAAGRGTRFGKLNAYLQKCMYPIAGKPFLEHTLANLAAACADQEGSGRVTLVVGHRGRQVADYFGGAYGCLKLDYVEQDEPRGTGDAVHRAYRKHGYREPAVVWLADAYFEPAAFAHAMAFPGPDALTLSRHVCDRDHHERVDVSEGRIARAWRGTGEYVDAGLWRLSPRLMGAMMQGRSDEVRVLLAVQNAIDQGVEVGALFTEPWIHLGGTEPSFEENLAAVTRFFLDRQKGPA